MELYLSFSMIGTNLQVRLIEKTRYNVSKLLSFVEYCLQLTDLDFFYKNL